MVCGVGAGVLQLLVGWLEYRYGNVGMMALMVPTVGASGAVFGLLLAFGVMHPNAVIMLLIPPIPMKAKWFVVVYGVIELFFGISGRMDGVAHFAHVGGMLWGIPAALLLETQRGDPLLIDEQGVLRRLQTRCFPETSESLPGSVFNGVMLILSVATGAAMIVTLLAPFVHPGANLDFFRCWGWSLRRFM